MKSVLSKESKSNGMQADIKNRMFLLSLENQTEPGNLGTIMVKDDHQSLLKMGIAMVKSNHGILTAKKKKKAFIRMGKKMEHGKDGLEPVKWNLNLNTKTDCDMDCVSSGIQMERKHFRFTMKRGNTTGNGWSGIKWEIK